MLTYNAEGKRTKKVNPTTTTKFIYDFEKVLKEADGSDVTTNSYTSTVDQYGDLVSAYDGTNTSYFEHDTLGSTDALLDDSETVNDRYRYRAFGLESHHQGTSTNPFSFVGNKGYHRDSEIDLYFVRARYYDHVTARWVSEDPLGYRAGDINLYRYVGNNPVNGIDPSGKALLVIDEGRSQRACRTGSGPVITRVPVQQLLEEEFNHYFRSQGFDVSIGFVLPLQDTVPRDGKWYYRFNFFWDPTTRFGVPPVLWNYARDQGTIGRSGMLTAATLLRLMSNYPEGYLLWHSADPRASRAIYTVGQLSLTELGADTSWLAVLGNLLKHVGNAIGDAFSNLASRALDALANVGRVALAALLKGFGFDSVDAFFEKIAVFAGKIVDIVGSLISSPSQFFSTLFTGVSDGFRLFGMNIGNYLQEGGLKWLFGQLTNIPPLPERFTVESTAYFFLQLVELTWEDVRLDLIRRIGQQTYDTLARGIDVLRMIDQKTPLQAITDLVDAAWAAIGDQAFRLADIWEQIVPAAVDILKNQLITTLVRNLVALIVPGGAVARIIVGIYSAVRWFLANVGELLRLFERLLVGIADNLVAHNAQGVANAVRDALGGLVVPALGLFAALAGFAEVPRQINQLIGRVRIWARRKKDAFIAWLFRLFGLQGNPCAIAARFGRLDPDVARYGRLRTVRVRDRRPLEERGAQRGFRRCLGSGTRMVERSVATSGLVLITQNPQRSDLRDPSGEAREFVRCLVGIGADPAQNVAGDDAGHIIANQFRGSGLGPMAAGADLNIFPVNLVENRRGGRYFRREELVADAVRAGRRVCLSVILDYSGSSRDFPGRPSRVFYDVWIGNQLNPDAFAEGNVIPNPP